MQANLDALTGDTQVKSIVLTGGGKVTADKEVFVEDKAALNRITEGFVFSDTVANVAAELNALEAEVSKISSVRFTNAGTPALAIKSTQSTADAHLIGEIAAPYVLDVTVTAGVTTTIGHGNQLTIADVKGTDAIAGGGTNETFVFKSGFGDATITDAAGHWDHSLATHDIIDLAKSEFVDGFTSLKSDASVVNGVISIAAGADRLIFDGITSKNQLNAAQRDFAFV